MNDQGWPYPARTRPWSDISGQYSEAGPDYAHLAAIVDSVMASNLSDELAAFTSMFDLMVVLASANEAPYDVIAVRTPASGKVLIEHLSPSGRNDQIERPAGDSVALFWRFITEKFGLVPEQRHDD